MSKIRKDLIEIIWYEMGDGLNTTDVDECAETIETYIELKITGSIISLLDRLYDLDDGTVMGLRKVSSAIEEERRLMKSNERS